MPVLGAAAGGGGGGQLPTIAFFGSQTWTPSYDVTAKVFVIGGGGGGAAKKDWNGKCSGGGAGGCAVSELTFSSGTAYTITIGAGGAGHSATSGSYNSAGVGNGSAGGNSSLSGSGITTMTANGGSGGVQVHTSGAACLGGAGGSASGGTIGNFTGGAGGLLTGIGDFAASGGGAVGLWTTGNAAPVGVTDGHVGKMGGSINWDHDTFTAAYSLNAGHPTNSNVKAPPVPTMPPFADLSAYEKDYATYDSSTRYGVGGTERKAGYMPNYRHYYISDNYYGGIAGPFCGGIGFGNTAAATNAGHGCLGGGGGGASATNSSACYGGEGGSGGVLIFPSSIG